MTIWHGSFLVTRRGRLILLLLCALRFLDVADSSIMNVALPSIRRNLGFSVQGLQWVLPGYLVTYGGLLLLAGRASGFQRALLGCAIFLLAAAVIALLAANTRGEPAATHPAAHDRVPAPELPTETTTNRSLTMKITVFGASGGIGSQVVALAEQRGHQVRAVYRSTPHNPPPSQAEALITPDIFDAGFAARAINGADVVVTTVGPNFATRHNPRTSMTSPADLHQRLARTIVAAMRESAVPARLIAVSTASMGPADKVMGPGPRLLFRFFRTVPVPNLGRVGKDLQAMEDVLAASGLDWYALRPVKLTDGPLTGNIRASDRFTMKTISRADVAWQILALAEDRAPRTPRTPVITSGPAQKACPALATRSAL